MRTGLVLLVLWLTTMGVLLAEEAYIRQPAAGGGFVFFTSEGDIWRVPEAGGAAQRLTTHAGRENHVAVSPDASLLAFSAAYEGEGAVYVMPVLGGLPRRLTFEEGGCAVLGWTPTGEILYNTISAYGPADRRVVVSVHPVTGVRRVFPLADVTEASMDPEGRMLYVTRLGLAMTRDNVRAYRGGAAPQIWSLDLDGKEEARQVPFDAPAHTPMVWGEHLVFVSDKDGAANLWMMRRDGSEARQLTFHKDWDVRSASLHRDTVAMQVGADLCLLDLKSGQEHRVPVTLVSDQEQQRLRNLKEPLQNLEQVALSADGTRLTLTARGQVVLAGTEPSRRVVVGIPEGARAREACLGPRGRWVYAFVSTGEGDQLWRFAADGTPGGKMLTRDADLARAEICLAPKGDLLAHTDRQGRVYLLDLKSGVNRMIDENPYGDTPSLTWAPDGRYLVITRADSGRSLRQLILLSVGEGTRQVLTSDKYEAFSPAFTPDGAWLYFLSNRHFEVVNRSPWGDRNMGPFFDRRSRLYAYDLRGKGSFPFRERTELDPDAASRKEDTGKKGESGPPLEVDWAGLGERLCEVPVSPGNYTRVRVDAQRLYLSEREGRGLVLRTLPLRPGPLRPEVFATGLMNFDLSENREQVLLVFRGSEGPVFHLVGAGPKAPADLTAARVNLADWCLTVDPRLEWASMFEDAWRMHKNHFYDQNMRGVDWQALHDRYARLVRRIGDRDELNDILGQMMGELGALHSQVRPGDLRQGNEGFEPAFLGAVLERETGGYRVAHIYRTEAERPDQAGPLLALGVDVREGDLITAVNGVPSTQGRDISDLLRNRAGQQTLLHLRRGDRPAHKAVVVPVNGRTQARLRYADWEEGCLEQVQKAGKGRLGYLHLRAMGAEDINTFAREFYGQYDREGLIVDVRRNHGGNIDSWVIEKLLRRAWSFWTNNRGEGVETNMQQTFRGHLVVLVDELTYSDGETFAAGIKALKLAPLVGSRTSGAGVWLSDGNRLVDGGQIRAAEMPQYAVSDGAWLIEGHGVEPDVTVVNLPRETFEGRDRQLETAIGLLLEKLKQEPVRPLKPQAIPSLKSGAHARG